MCLCNMNAHNMQHIHRIDTGQCFKKKHRGKRIANISRPTDFRGCRRADGNGSSAENWNLEIFWSLSPYLYNPAISCTCSQKLKSWRGLRFSFLVVQTDLQIGSEQVAWLHGAIDNSNYLCWNGSSCQKSYGSVHMSVTLLIVFGGHVPFFLLYSRRPCNNPAKSRNSSVKMFNFGGSMVDFALEIFLVSLLLSFDDRCLSLSARTSSCQEF